MRFKTIFLIFALAMFMLSGVAWAEDDDDQGDNDDQQDSTSLTFHVYETDPEDFPTIEAVYGPDACVQANTKVDVEIDASDDDDEETTVGEALDDEGVLETLSEHYMDLVPSVLLICAFSGDDYLTQVEEVLYGFKIKYGEDDAYVEATLIKATNVVKFKAGSKLKSGVK